MYCGLCGSAVPDTASFCPACGKPLNNAATVNGSANGAPYDDATSVLFEADSEYQTGLLVEPASEYETGLLTEPASEYETGLLYEPESEYETGLLAEPASEYETSLLYEPDSEDATGLLVDDESEFETSLLAEPDSEFETGLLVEPDSEDATTLLDGPDGATTVIAANPDGATTVIGAQGKASRPQATATAAGATPRRRKKFQRAYELPDSALQPQTEPTFVVSQPTAPTVVQSQPIYVMPVAAQGTGPMMYGPATQTVEKKGSRGVLAAVIGAALAVALALFIAFQMGLIGGVRVPDVTGLSPDNAIARLEDAGFSVETYEEKVDQGVGIVTSLEPAASTSLSRGSTVRVGIGVARVVPDVFGINVDEAIDMLSDEGALEIVIERKFSDDYENDTVIAVSPAPGNKFNANDTVTLTVAQKRE